MREYLYNIKMAVKKYGFIKSFEFIAVLTVLHLKKIIFKGSRERKDKLHGFYINFFDYATLTGLYEEIFIQRQYYFSAAGSEPVIIDCGSNIGMSMLYFKWLYPECRITVFEPDASAFEMLKNNVKDNNLKSVTLVNSAVAGKNGMARFFSEKNRPANLHMSLLEKRVNNADFVNVKKTVLSQYIDSDVDFLKMDVEGAEAEIISELEKSKKLSKIRLMAVEIHHNISDGADLLNSITCILKKHRMKYNLKADCAVPFIDAAFQDIMMYAKREKTKGGQNK